MTRFAQIKMPHVDTVNDAIVWCYEKFGNPIYPITGDHGWAVVRPGVFSFKNEEDAVLFALRWA
jgi:hypothetical protein